MGSYFSANGPRCFVAGTKITLADGSEKSIEDIVPGDMVLSFDPDAEGGLGASKPSRVTRTFQNTTRVLLDVCCLHVTTALRAYAAMATSAAKGAVRVIQ